MQTGWNRIYAILTLLLHILCLFLSLQRRRALALLKELERHTRYDALSDEHRDRHVDTLSSHSHMQRYRTRRKHDVRIQGPTFTACPRILTCDVTEHDLNTTYEYRGLHLQRSVSHQ